MSPYNHLRKEIELYNHFQRLILAFPQCHIDRKKTIELLQYMIHIEYGAGCFELPSLQQNKSQLIFQDLLRKTNAEIRPRIITEKIQRLYHSYEQLKPMQGTAERIKMTLEGEAYQMSMKFNMMEFKLSIKKGHVQSIQRRMKNSKWLPLMIMLYCLRCDLLCEEFRWGLFPDLDQLADHYSLKFVRSARV